MPEAKRTADSKRTSTPRDVTKAPKFVKDWERLSRSGKHDLHRLKEAMLLLMPTTDLFRQNGRIMNSRATTQEPESATPKETYC